MNKRMNIQFKNLLFLIVFLLMHSAVLKGQYTGTSKNYYYSNRLYHKKTGWVNSVGIYKGNWEELIKSFTQIPELPSFQIDYLRYKLIQPRVGLGGGVALKLAPTRQYGYEEYGFYTFAELYGYGKIFLTNSRRRIYLDTKLGYAKALGDFEFSCHGCNGEGPLYLRYSSGPTIQPGIGVEFAKAGALRYGLKLSFYCNPIIEQTDIYPSRWKVTNEGVIKRRRNNRSLTSLSLGFNFFI